jgi:hypothetical protein
MFAFNVASSGDSMQTFSNPLQINNPFHPFVDNRLKVSSIRQGHTDAQVIDVYSTERRTFTLTNGTTVSCATLIEVEIEDGELTEISSNYFAQADNGTVYYFGEVVDIYENGVIVSHDGSWLVGGPVGNDPVETATAMVPAEFMPANPKVGDTFKPEDLFPVVEETDVVVKTGQTVTVQAGKFTNTIKIQETLLSGDVEFKWYAPGVGFIQAKEPGEILELTAVIDTADADQRNDVLEELLDVFLDE